MYKGSPATVPSQKLIIIQVTVTSDANDIRQQVMNYHSQDMSLDWIVK